MQGKFDLPDAVISPFFVLSSAIAMGLIGFSLMGFDLASTALEFTADGYTSQVSYAGIVSLLTSETLGIRTKFVVRLVRRRRHFCKLTVPVLLPARREWLVALWIE